MSSEIGNVYFYAVARLSGSGSVIVASFNYKTETSIDAVETVLNQPNLQITSGKLNTFIAGSIGWNLIAGNPLIKHSKILNENIFETR